MASQHCHFTVFGHLTRDPQVRYSRSNMPICEGGIACNRYLKDPSTGQWKPHSDFFPYVIYGKTGEAFAAYHSTGDKTFFEGRLQNRRGPNEHELVLAVQFWQFVGGNRPKKPVPDEALGKRHAAEIPEEPF